MRLIAALLLVLASILAPHTPGSAGEEAKTGRYYVPTKRTLAPQFVDFFDRYGGVPLFGYPITEARIEEDSQGKGYLVQWTERQRLEWHPDKAGTPYEVLLGLLGRELTGGYEGPSFRRITNYELRVTNERYFPETGQVVSEPFLSYWGENGGVRVFGYPISALHTDDRGFKVQWFERARLEHHPELPEPYKVLLGHLGLEAMRNREADYYELEVHNSLAPDTTLRLGLAQGGESEDPGFFDNVRVPGRELGPGLLRLDNIFNFYNIVQRGSDGKITYNWRDFDRVIDGVRAMGKEPLICLSYMPEAMSSQSNSRVVPPVDYAEWADLVRATVHHLNVERKLGVRYWEVWNEPDQWSFWQAPYPEYLKLYDVTVEAALSADSTVRVGGPAVARFSEDHLHEFLMRQAARGDKGRVDFLSWHSYGRSPQELAAQIRKAREIVSHYPQFSPELMISEFNVLQGGPNDSSANGHTDTVEGAIALLSYIESMQRERLDHALLFELKDGKGPGRYWGRWGVLNFDGEPKPIYHALKAYQTRPGKPLPVQLQRGSRDGEVGLIAYSGPNKKRLMLWYTGEKQARVKINLPPSFSSTQFTLTLFDRDHNNPARSADSKLRPWMERNADDLLLDLRPNSLVLIDSR